MKRRAIVYTLTPIILIAFATVIGMAVWHRSHMTAELGNTLAHGEKAQAEAAARQLAVVSNPPIDLLVRVAASEDRARADAAQLAISRILDRLEREADAGQRLQRASATVNDLAEALAEHRRAFPPASHTWLADTVRRILQVANQCSTKMPLIGLHCDDVLSVAKLTRPAAASVAINLTPPQTLAAQGTPQTGLEREFSAFNAKPLMPVISPTPSISTASEAHVEPAPVPNVAENPNVGAQRLPPASLDNGAHTPSRSEPAFRMLPTTPVQSKRELQPFESTSASQAASSAPRIEDTRDLLNRWRTSRSERSEIEEELATRGFRPIPKHLVEQYFSENLADRLRLVDSVLTEPGIDARPWLMLLADDDNAEVRLMAVTVMATSDDKTLVEKAWQTALHDRDSRIADLAARLRQRREGAIRR